MHNIYSYHAKFTPEIPRNFIEKYSQIGETVLDPFCGCGTTLLEALKLGRNAIGIDLSPVGILCSKVKTYVYDRALIEKYAEFVMDVEAQHVLIPTFPDREKWFNEEVLNGLGMLNYNIMKIKDKKYQELFLLVLLSILNNCARKRKTWNLGYLADNVMPNQDCDVDVMKLYDNKIKQLKRRKDFLAISKNFVKCVESDIINVKGISDVDLVVTSPPYPFAVDFIRYHRLALYWLEKPVEKLSDLEVGARNKRSRKDATETFYQEMKPAYLCAMKMVKNGGYWAMTIGDTTRNKKKVEFVNWTIAFFERNGWKLKEKTSRCLEQQTMAQKRIKVESMLVFVKRD